MLAPPNLEADRCPTHPGAFLREVVLPAMPMPKTDLARALGMSRQSLYELLAERKPVTAATALRLGAVFDTSPAAWLNMQSAYDLWHAARELDSAGTDAVDYKIAS
jgi:addiction module HigA family antidote